jgi:hypothetical protein
MVKLLPINLSCGMTVKISKSDLKGDQHKTKRLSLVDEWQQEFELL